MSIETIKQAASRQIWVSFRKEGIHRYPAAGEIREYFGVEE